MIVASVLLFVGAVAAMSCISAATRSVGLSGEYTTASMLAQQHFAEMESQQQQQNSGQISAGEQQGDFDQYPGFHWSQSTETTEVDGLFKVTLIVEWTSGSRMRNAQFATYIQQPQQQQMGQQTR